MCKEDVSTAGRLQLVSAAAHVRIPIAAKPSCPRVIALYLQLLNIILGSAVTDSFWTERGIFIFFYNAEYIRTYTESSVRLRDLIGQRACCCSFTLTAVIYPRGTASGIS